MFINRKGKDKEKSEIIPVGQLDAKGECSKMKNVTTGNILSVHRIPLDLMNIVREGFSPVGDLNRSIRCFTKMRTVHWGNKLELNELV